MVANMVRRSNLTRTRRVAGAPLIPYIRPSRFRLQPWLRIPASFPGSNLEWIVMWYFTVYGIDPNRRKLRINKDFYWQKAQTAPGLFLGKGFTRSDFVIPHWPGAPRGLVLDPLTNFTHAAAWLDLRKRNVLIGQGWRLIFLDGIPLMSNPKTVIEAALDGVDLSKRAGKALASL